MARADAALPPPESYEIAAARGPFGTPREHPVLAADRLIPQPALRHVIVDRQPAVLRVPA